MANEVQRKDNEKYDDRPKGADEIFCASCGVIIKKDAEVCPKCGVRNKSNEKLVESIGKPKGNIGWLIFWIIIFWPVAIWYGITRKFS